MRNFASGWLIALTFGGHPIGLVDGHRTTRLAAGGGGLSGDSPGAMETDAALVGALAEDSGTQSARDLISAGWQPGPAIGEELRRQRSAAQDGSR